MKTLLGRSVGAALALALALPGAVAAHPGHGDHGWLAGALQPLLSLDHFMAGLFALGVGSVVVGAVAIPRRRARAGEAGAGAPER